MIITVIMRNFYTLNEQLLIEKHYLRRNLHNS
jgi:hypothetical protein